MIEIPCGAEVLGERTKVGVDDSGAGQLGALRDRPGPEISARENLELVEKLAHGEAEIIPVADAEDTCASDWTNAESGGGCSASQVLKPHADTATA